MTMYFVSCTRKIDLTTSNLDLLNLYLSHICYCNKKIYCGHMNNPVLYMQNKDTDQLGSYPPPEIPNIVAQ